MCECGCGELRPIAKIQAGDGKWLMLEIYPGCNNGCGTSWGLGITELEDDNDWGDLIAATPTVELDPRFRQWGTMILDTGILKKHFAEVNGDDDELSDANFAFEEFVSRGELIEVYRKTRQAHPIEPPKSAGESQAQS